MVYRIHFETKGSYWCIQFKSLWALRWDTAMEEVPVEGSEQSMALRATTLRVKRFETYDAAVEHVEQSGIDAAYDQRVSKTRSSAMQTDLMNFPIPKGYVLMEDPRNRRE